MLIVPDVQDVYTPLQSDVIVPLSEVSFKYFLLEFWQLSFKKVFTFQYLTCLLLLHLVPSTLTITSGKHSYHVPK